MKFAFHKLTPRDDVEIGIYRDALDYVFEQDDLRNIAVTGPFGAGKSSILESYKKQRCDLNFIHISLARFDEPTSPAHGEEPEEEENANGKGDGHNSDKDNDKMPVHSLEGKVINQLIHSIDSQKVPKTGFGIKRELSFSSSAQYALFLMGLILLPVFIYLFDDWTLYATKLNGLVPKWLLNHWVRLVAGLVWVLLVFIATFLFVRFLHGKNVFSKISIKGNSIEIFPNEDDSPLPVYWDLCSIKGG